MNCPQCAFENPDDSRYCSRCGNKISLSGKIAFNRDALQALTREFKIGSIFLGRYLIIEELGKGGMGSVYKVLDKEVDEKIALKLLNPEIASNEKQLCAFGTSLRLPARYPTRMFAGYTTSARGKESITLLWNMCLAMI